MLGDDMMVAPVVEKGAKSRQVKLPAGSWEDNNGNVYEGNSVIEIPVTIESIPYFTLK